MPDAIPPACDQDAVGHVAPMGDRREHITNKGGKCWCDPTIEAAGSGWIVIHNALDGRKDDVDGNG